MMPRVEQARALKSIGFSDAAVEAVVSAPDESARAAASVARAFARSRLTCSSSALTFHCIF